MLDTEVCKFCKAEFYTGTLDENGKCTRCQVVFPNAVTPEDIKEKSEEDVENEGRLVNRITNQVNALLEKYGILSVCGCGNFYYKRSPAQKSCGCGTNIGETK